MTRTAVPVLINRDGGTAKADPGIADKVGDALAQAGIDCAIELIDGDGCADRCKALVALGHRLIIVGGGDGTIGAAASVLCDTDTALGILPLGTLNHFAGDLGIESALDKAAATIAAGRRAKVDVAEVNGRTFINNSAIGLYPRMVIDREAQQQRLGRSKRLALLVAAVRTLFRFEHQQLTLAVNDHEARVDTPLLFVGNNDYRLDISGAGQRSSLAQGRLCVLVMARNSRLGFLAAVARALAGRTRREDLIRIDDVTEIRVDSKRSSLRFTLDGEVATMAPPLRYRIRPGALTVVAP